MPLNYISTKTPSRNSEDDPEAFYKASDLILHNFEKIAGRFESIGLVKISFPVEEIFTVRLKN